MARRTHSLPIGSNTFPSLSAYYPLSPVADRLVCQEDKCPLRSSDRDASTWEKSLQYPFRMQPDGSKQRQCLPPPPAFKDEVAKDRATVAEGRVSRARGNHHLSQLQLQSGKWG